MQAVVPSRGDAPATEVLRVAVDGRYVGFIDAGAATTLLEARELIGEFVDDVPAAYTFLLSDGVPVSRRQEALKRALDCRPALILRPDESHAARQQNSAAKICITSALGAAPYHAWAVPDSTFGQLRRSAAAYWSVAEADVVLQDGDGVAWPEEGSVLSVWRHVPEEARQFVLALKPAAMVSTPAAAVSVSPPPPVTPAAAAASPPPAVSPAAVTPADAKPARKVRRAKPKPQPQPDESAEQQQQQQPQQHVDDELEVELYRIFSFYAIQGDSLDLGHIKPHQLVRMLDDCGLLSARFTRAHVNILYTAACRSAAKSSSAGKLLSFEEFLDVLMAVAVRLCGGGGGGGGGGGDGEREEEAAFQQLVLDHLLPGAFGWDLDAWHAASQRLQQPEVVSIFDYFAEPLFEIFKFYAPAPEPTPQGLTELLWTYQDYLKFAHDFKLSELQLKSKEVAEVFLGAVRAGGVRTQLSAQHESQQQQQLLLLHGVVDAAVLPSKAATSVSRPRMSFPQLLDSIGRAALLVVPRQGYDIPATDMVKSVLHHLQRCLSRSRVMSILANRRNLCSYPAGLMNGSMAFSTRFMAMWRREGSKDYLTGQSLDPNAAAAAASSSPYATTDTVDTSPTATRRERGRDVFSRMVSSGSPVPSSAAASPPPVLAPAVTPAAQAQAQAPAPAPAPAAAPAAAAAPQLAPAPSPTRPPAHAFAANGSPPRAHAPLPGHHPTAAPTRGSGVRSPRMQRASPSSPSRTRSRASPSREPPAPAPSPAPSPAPAPAPSREAPAPAPAPAPATPEIDETDETDDEVEEALMTAPPAAPPSRAAKAAEAAEAARAAAEAAAALHAAESETDSDADSSLAGMSGLSELSSEDEAGGGYTDSDGGDAGAGAGADTEAAANDERFTRMLMKGNVFRKHGKGWSGPQRRYVWCPETLDAVRWRSMTAKSSQASKSKDAIRLRAVREIAPGVTPGSKFPKSIDPDVCLSIVASDRRLDIEADSQATRDEWVEALRWLVSSA